MAMHQALEDIFNEGLKRMREVFGAEYVDKSLANANDKPARAISSEVDPVRVKKTRQNNESRAPFRFYRNGKGSGRG